MEKRYEVRVYPEGLTESEARELGIYLPRQTHSCHVEEVVDGRYEYPDTDALISAAPGVGVGVRTADCVPILLYCADRNVAAAVHAGWRGSLGGIIDAAVMRLKSMGCDIEQMQAFFGVSICCGCYEVDHELEARFAEAGFADCVFYPERESVPAEDCHPIVSRPHIDLQKVNISRLKKLGLDQGNVHTSDKCTFHSVDSQGRPLYPSWRREKGTDVRMVTAIMLL